eukprot:3504862-Amphidinium_carterae.1
MTCMIDSAAGNRKSKIMFTSFSWADATLFSEECITTSYIGVTSHCLRSQSGHVCIAYFPTCHMRSLQEFIDYEVCPPEVHALQ